MVSSLVRESDPLARMATKWILVGGAIALIALVALLALPGSIASKTHLALHGICAQRPSHSLHLGGSILPLDARMTGLYIGAVVTGLWLIAAGRTRNTKIPPRTVLAMLIFFVAILAIDGFNALAADLGYPHPYAPSNTPRIATGVLGGTTMGVVLVHLVAGSMWARAHRHQAVVARPVELLPPVFIGVVIAMMALSGLPILYAPLAIGLVVAAVGVFAAMGMVVLALASNRAWSCHSYRDLAPLACAGLITAMVAIGALSWFRLLAESWFGLPRLT